jgi:hypothetical protein
LTPRYLQSSIETLIKNNKNLEVIELRKLEENSDEKYSVNNSYDSTLLTTISENCLGIKTVKIDSSQYFPCDNVVHFIQSCSSLQLFEFKLFDGPDSFGHIYYVNDLNGRIVLDVFQIEDLNINYIIKLLSAKPFTIVILDWAELVDDYFWNSLTPCVCHSLCEFTFINCYGGYSVKSIQNFIIKCVKLTKLDIEINDLWCSNEIIETFTTPNKLRDISLKIYASDFTVKHALQILDANPQIINASMTSTHDGRLLAIAVKKYMENRLITATAI